MKKILVPVDFSKYSENAFLSALKIAEKLDARLSLVNVVNTMLEWDKLSTDEKTKYKDIIDQEVEAKEKLEAFVQGHHIGKVPVDIVIKVGVPFEEILSLAQKEEIELIVIGAYGRGTEGEKFIGSNIQKVIRKASCPVLAVKHALDGNSWRKMAITTSLNSQLDENLDKLIPLFDGFHPSLHLLYINTPEHFMADSKTEILLEELAQKFNGFTVHQHIYNHPQVENGIVDFCKSRNIGWITIVSDHKGENSSYQIGVTDTVLFKTALPVLSLHAG
ncbi:universal stress protein [Echinicola marina]|uniref:universal stress protein n=1 Tax=Echinicola marina TaxID=2859768 RepID=UPI001CF6549E|nr:universal stress protein [Echinicola marina]UCS92032.1 universal stress protein [Echinicola marina]